MSTYRLTVDVELPDDLDDGPLYTLASIVLSALNEGEVRVHRVKVENRSYPSSVVVDSQPG
jgi:hypothetical protein